MRNGDLESPFPLLTLLPVFEHLSGMFEGYFAFIPTEDSGQLSDHLFSIQELDVAYGPSILFIFLDLIVPVCLGCNLRKMGDCNHLL